MTLSTTLLELYTPYLLVRQSIHWADGPVSECKSIVTYKTLSQGRDALGILMQRLINIGFGCIPYGDGLHLERQHPLLPSVHEYIKYHLLPIPQCARDGGLTAS